VKKGKKKTVKKAKPAPKKKVAKAKPKTTAAKPPKKEPETMERKALKVIASQLKEMGSDIRVLKSDTDEGLQKKVNEALQELPQGEALKKLEKVDPSKILPVLTDGCLGIFINLSDISCVQCGHAAQCASLFLKNLKGGMAVLDKALPPPVKLKPVTKYKSKRLCFVRDVANPNPTDDPYHDTINRVLKDQPETLGELRAIIEDDFDIESDEAFMKLVTSMRDPEEGILKLVEDLTEKNKAELIEAGYEL